MPSPSVSPAGRRLRPVLVALSLIAAVLGMHGLTSGVIGPGNGSMAAMALSDLSAPIGAPHGGHPAGHDGPTAAAHHGCVAAQTATSPSVVAPTAHLTAPAPTDVARHAPLRAGSDASRAPPDLNALCVSRT